MNRRLFPLALSLALLAGCAPAPEPTPEPTPTPAAAVDFHAFLDAVNEKRRAVIEEGEPLDISPWTPDFAGQNPPQYGGLSPSREGQGGSGCVLYPPPHHLRGLRVLRRR